MSDDDKILKELLNSGIESSIIESEEPQKVVKPKKVKDEEIISKSKEVKPEEIAYETPQDRFKKIIKDQGYRIGLDNLTNVFFRGNTDDPVWLDQSLILSNIPAKNREIIISSYYGRTLDELGIKIEPGSKNQSNTSSNIKLPTTSKDIISDDVDVSKMAERELSEMFKAEKFKTSMAQIRAMRKDYERDLARDEELRSSKHQPQVYTRQISRPVIRDGKIITNPDGSPLYETVVEPVNPNQQQSGIGEVMPLLTTLLTKDNKPQNTELAELFRRFDERMAAMERSNELRSKEDQIKRLEDEQKRVAEQFRRDLDQKEKENKEGLAKLEADRIRELHALETRFTETISHRKELDSIIGNISQEHKKEMDSIKQQLSHAQTNIERTVVSKGTDTVDKLTTKFADIAESVIKPMAGVMKDQYTLAIDQQRKASGLPPIRESIPEVGAEELSQFIKE